MDPLEFESEVGYLDKLLLHFLLVPSSVLLKLNDGSEKGKFNQRVIVSIADIHEWQGGIVALGEGNGYITLSKSRMKLLGLREGSRLKIQLRKDTSEFGHEFPEELAEIFAQDEEAERRFRGLSPGKQRTLIYYILQVKSSEKRIERSLLFMNNLKLLPPGMETMKGLFGKPS